MTISIGVYRKLSKNKNKDKTGKQPNVKKNTGVSMGVRRVFSRGAKATFCLSFSGFYFLFYIMLLFTHNSFHTV